MKDQLQKKISSCFLPIISQEKTTRESKLKQKH